MPRKLSEAFLFLRLACANIPITRQKSGSTSRVPKVCGKTASVLQVTFRFYAELNDFLSPEGRMTAFSHPLFLPASIKDIIESMGVPHTEVSLILVNSEPVEFTHVVRDGDRISVYPSFTSLDVSSLLRLRPQLRDMRFAVDTHLGRLATYLRMLGLDALYEIGSNDRELSQISARESRILLTRDRGLLKRGEVTYGYFVRATEPRQQLLEVLRRFNLSPAAAPLRRCLRCNVLLQPVSKEAVHDRLPPRTTQCFHQFQICPTCNRLYWAGSHYEHMQRFIGRVLAA